MHGARAATMGLRPAWVRPKKFTNFATVDEFSLTATYRYAADDLILCNDVKRPICAATFCPNSSDTEVYGTKWTL